MLRDLLRWADTGIGFLAVLTALIVLPLTCVRTLEGQTTQPADVYRIAGEARRAAGIETWMFVHPTWLNWNPDDYTSEQAAQLLDGYLLIIVPGHPDAGLEAALQAKLKFCVRGSKLRILPGMRVGPDKSYAEWTQPEVWQADLDTWHRIVEAFELGPGAPFVGDSEPYWEGTRYPRSQDKFATASAMDCWRKELSTRDVWLAPMHPDLFNTWTLASWAASAGRTVYAMDEGTYSRMGGDDAALEKTILERQSLYASLGMTYVPGFYLRHAIDPGLYDVLKRCGVKRCWFFAQAVEDDYSNFGTPKWRHAQ